MCGRLRAVPKLRVGVLVSHHGSNLRALHQASLKPGAQFTVCAAISNNSRSAGLAYARDNAIPTQHLSGKTHLDPDYLDEAIRTMLVAHSVDWVITAGYLKKLGPQTLRQFSPRILNIHPALLPRHGGVGMYGLNVHRAVLAAGDRISGPSIHLVEGEYDTGRVLAQLEVPVLPKDTADSLAARVLEAEHTLLPRVVQQIAATGQPPHTPG